MKKIKNILIIGLGSIGARHFEIIKQLRPEINIYLLRRKKSKRNNLEKSANKIFYDIQEALKANLDAVIISSPSSMHINQAISFLDLNIPIFIEKPISNNLEDFLKFKRLAKKKNSLILVGYVLRYSKILNEYKKLIKENTIGKHIYIDIKCSSFLPDWRENIDYKNSVSSKNSLGGGVLLELSHELDYANWLFGPFIELKAIRNNTKQLEIDVEDIVKIIAINKDKCLINIHLDFISKIPSRYCCLNGTKGFIKLDFIKNKITSKLNIEKELKSHKVESNYNEMYFNQMKHFFKCIEQDTEPAITLEESAEIMRMVEICKLSPLN